MSFGPENKICLTCGEPFFRRKANTWAYWERAKYCSNRCAGRGWTKRADGRRPSVEDKFRSYILKTEGCWSWTGPRDKDGYAVFFHAKKQYRAPPFALKLDGRPVPEGMYACHHCDNPECVNPEHLYVGTPKQNAADMFNRGRARPYFGRSSS